jgi:hypothetical protein
MRVWAAIAVVVAIFAFATSNHGTQRVTYFDRSSDACEAVDQKITTCDVDAFGIDIQSVRVWYVGDDLDVTVSTRGLNTFNTNDDRSLFVIGTPSSPWPFGYRVAVSTKAMEPRLQHPLDQYVDCPNLKLTIDLVLNTYDLVVPRSCLDDADEVQVSVVTDNYLGSCTLACTKEHYDTWTSPWVSHHWGF